MTEQNSFLPPKTNENPIVDDDNQVDYMSELVGEGKKYSTPEDAFKGLYHAQKHIEDLTGQIKQRNSVEDLLSKIDEKVFVATQKEEPAQPAIVDTKAQEPTRPEAEPKGEELEELIRKVLTERDSEQTSSQNMNQVATTLDKYYGNREAANRAVENRAKDLGLSVDFLQQVAAKSPKAFFAQMGLDSANKTQNTPAAPAPNTVFTETLTSNKNLGKPKPHTQAWYRELQKTDLTKYRSHAVQKQMMDDLERDPDFFLGRKN